MTQNISSDNLSTIRTFFSALERHDKSALGPLLATDAAETVPFSRTGSAEPEAEFRGKEAVLGYLGSIIDNFTQTVLTDKQFYVSEDASTVFVEAKGDLVLGGTSAPYNNVYVFKFAFENGVIVHIKEYANPVTYAKLMDLPVG